MDEELDDEVAKPSKLPLIIASVVCLLLGAGGGYGAATVLGGGDEAAVASADGAEEAPEEPAQIQDLGEFTVNLRNTAGGRMLQMSMSVMVTESAMESFAENQPKMRDAVLLLASDYTVAELDGGDNKLRFRDEILTRLNSVMGSEAVRSVYLTTFVVQ